MEKSTLESDVTSAESGLLPALLKGGAALLTAADIAKLFRYPSVQAVHKARLRGTLVVPMTKIPARKGWFATTRSVVEYLAQLETQMTVTARGPPSQDVTE